MVHSDNHQDCRAEGTVVPPLCWSDADRELLQRAAFHVQSAIEAGELPALAASGSCDEDAALQWLPPLHEMLMELRADAADAALAQLAGVFASACFGSQHLWQDLGLRGRDEVSRLMELGFPALFAANVRDLRWKRHLFLCLGERLGQPGINPPKCDRCDAFDGCVGSKGPGAVVDISPSRRS